MNNLEQAARQAHDAICASHAKRLALELECLLLDCQDTAVVSKWFDSATEALENYRAELNAFERSTTLYKGIENEQS